MVLSAGVVVLLFGVVVLLAGMSVMSVGGEVLLVSRAALSVGVSLLLFTDVGVLFLVGVGSGVMIIFLTFFPCISFYPARSWGSPVNNMHGFVTALSLMILWITVNHGNQKF